MTKLNFSNYGALTLDAHCAKDLDVVNAAKVSFAKQVAKYGDDEKKILRFLIRKRHGSPFEHNYFKWHIRAPMIVWWEWVRHRMASYNLESGRYVELRPDFYLPDQARIQVGRPGAYTFENGSGEQTEWLHRSLKEYAYLGFAKYQGALDRGIAKEQARLFLPTNLFVEGYFSCNARALMNFLSLRNDEHAMQDIRDYAIHMELIWKTIMPDTAEAFVEYGRMAP